MKRKPDQHGIFKNNQGDHWCCGFGRCKQTAEFIIVETFGNKEERKGACKPHALKWAEKGNCPSCLNKINEVEK